MKKTLFTSLFLVAFAPMVGATLMTGANLPVFNADDNEMIAGDGIPIGNFAVDTAATGESVALKARNRDTGEPVSFSGTTYQVSPGLSTVQSPGQPQLSFDFQFSPGDEPATDYLLELKVDFDTGTGQDFAIIRLPLFDSDSDPTNSWDDTDGYFTNGNCGAGPSTCAWSRGDDYVYSQSWQFGFAFWKDIFNKDYDPFADALYDIMFTAYAFDADEPTQLFERASVMIQAQVGAVSVPEPASIALLGLGLAGLGVKRRILLT